MAEFISKNLATIEASSHSCLGFLAYFGFLAILNVLSRNTLSEAVILDKSLKSP